MAEQQAPLTWGDLLSWAEANDIGDEFVITDPDGRLYRGAAVSEDPFRGRPAIELRYRQE